MTLLTGNLFSRLHDEHGQSTATRSKETFDTNTKAKCDRSTVTSSIFGQYIPFLSLVFLITPMSALKMTHWREEHDFKVGMINPSIQPNVKQIGKKQSNLQQIINNFFLVFFLNLSLFPSTPQQ
ncbi:unnamed protein product [Mucor fragilis]